MFCSADSDNNSLFCRFCHASLTGSGPTYDNYATTPLECDAGVAIRFSFNIEVTSVAYEGEVLTYFEHTRSFYFRRITEVTWDVLIDSQ
jgi:hypothetical protein